MPTRPPVFTGLSAFPLTPVTDDGIDAKAFTGLIQRLTDARVDSITALGSTGSYAYLNRSERREAVELAVRFSPPVSYQRLTDDEVYFLFRGGRRRRIRPGDRLRQPRHHRFHLHRRPARPHRRARPGRAIKIPPVAGGYPAIQERIRRLRERIPADVTIGISGDPVAADALRAGCDAWYSVLGGTLPDPCRSIVDAIRKGDATKATEITEQLRPVWDLFTTYGSYRVVSAIAENLGLVGHPNLPRPVRAWIPPAAPRSKPHSPSSATMLQSRQLQTNAGTSTPDQRPL